MPVIAPCAPKAEPTTCFKIREVLGVSMCTKKLTEYVSRCGWARSDEEISYQLRGKFGKSRDEDVDDMISDTRHAFATAVRPEVEVYSTAGAYSNERLSASQRTVLLLVRGARARNVVPNSIFWTAYQSTHFYPHPHFHTHTPCSP